MQQFDCVSTKTKEYLGLFDLDNDLFENLNFIHEIQQLLEHSTSHFTKFSILKNTGADTASGFSRFIARYDVSPFSSVYSYRDTVPKLPSESIQQSHNFLSLPAILETNLSRSGFNAISPYMSRSVWRFIERLTAVRTFCCIIIQPLWTPFIRLSAPTSLFAFGELSCSSVGFSKGAVSSDMLLTCNLQF